MKKLISTTMVLAVSSLFGGLYFVSGFDGRIASIKYTMETTEANQMLTIAPSKLVTLGAWKSNTDYMGDWIIKTDNQEFTYKYNDNINNTGLGDDYQNVE